MRDPEMISRAQRAAASLERAWERWRAMHGLAAEPMPPVSSYVGYSTEEPWGRPRVVFGVDAREAELLAALLDRLEGVGPFYQGGQSNGHHVATRHAGTGQIGTDQIGTGHAEGDRAASAYPASGHAAIDHPIGGHPIGGHPIGGRADNGYRGTDNGYAGNGYAGTDGRYASNGRAASVHPADGHPADGHPEGTRAAGDHPNTAQPAKVSYGPDPILDEVRSRIPAPAQAAEEETRPRRDPEARPEVAASSVSISETSLDLPRYRDEPGPAVPADGQDAPRDASYAEPGDAPGQDGEDRSGRRRGELSRGTRRRTSSRQRLGTRQTGPQRPLTQGDSPEPAAARARVFDADDAFESDEDWPALLRADSEPDSGAGLAPGAPAGRDQAGPAGQHDGPDTAGGHAAADAPPARSRQDQQEASWDSAASAHPDDATDAADDRDEPGWDSARLPSQGQLLEPSWDLAPDRELGTGRGRGTDAAARSRESAPDGPASTHWAPVNEPGQARDSGQEPRRDTPGCPDLPSTSAASRTRPAGSGTSVMPELSSPGRPAERHTDRNDSLTPDLPGPLTAGDVLAGAARQGSMNMGTSRPSPRSDTIAAELAGWASGELPGQASARLAAWAAIGGVPSPGYQSAGASGVGAPGLGTTEVVR